MEKTRIIAIVLLVFNLTPAFSIPLIVVLFKTCYFLVMIISILGRIDFKKTH